MATPQKYNDIYILKKIKQLSFKNKLEISPFTSLPLANGDTFGLLLKYIFKNLFWK
jgi:hypothetical protein